MDAAFPLDQFRHARRGPQAGFVPQRFRATFQFLLNAPQLGHAQPRFASCPPGLLQRRTTLPLHTLGPV